MKQYLVGVWRSLPVQLFLLHFRRYQVFLIFWYILFATVAGEFMFTFGANALFLAPEYFGGVNALSTGIVGLALGIFIMSWNITTFILHSRSLRFLATTAQPFLKYCINNALLPLTFVLYYLFRMIYYSIHQELLPDMEVFILAGGFMGGIVLSIVIGFIYFFGADKTIYYTMGDVIKKANSQYEEKSAGSNLPQERSEIRVEWFLSARLHLRKPRDVRHYSEKFLDSVFKRHHAAAVIAILVAFIFLVSVGYISDSRLFQLPAAASITIFFALLIALAGAVSLLLGTWSIPVLVVLYIMLNILYQKEIIDPRNKAYGLNYQNKEERPAYTKESINAMASASNMEKDKQFFLQVLNRWKARQKTDKPVLYMINTSGGGARSAVFTMNVLQRLDSLFHGNLMNQVFLINGASGGMLGAAYFRELYYEKIQGKRIDLHDRQYVDNISKDLLNPLFSSFVSRDLIGPVQKFTYHGYRYSKDRGYAFERKLAENTNGVFEKTLKDYAAAEASAQIPVMFFNSVINRDGRKMIMGTHPARFLMRPHTDTTHITYTDPDAIDFTSFFQKQDAENISILSALRMNATFPYVLPSVWLPSTPIIDVMDAGLRDNFGQETSLRFIDVFKDWLKENTSKVVLIQIRDRSLGDWEKPLEGNSLVSLLTQPFLVLQNNWFKLQDYYQHDQLQYLSDAYGKDFYRLTFQYVPERKDAAASLSFRLTAAEKKDIERALNNPLNQHEFNRVQMLRP